MSKKEKSSIEELQTIIDKLKNNERAINFPFTETLVQKLIKNLELKIDELKKIKKS
jgi:hypothetical protein